MTRALPLLAALLLGCVSREVQRSPSTWDLFTEDPLVATAGEPASPGAPQDDDDLLRLLTRPASPADLDPDFLSDQPPSPFHRLGPNVIRGIDGSWTKMYTVRTGRGPQVVKLLQSYVPGFPAVPDTPHDASLPPSQVIRWSLLESFVRDDFSVVQGAGGDFGEKRALARPEIADVLHVTAPPETLLFITELLHRVLADLPQIELQVRVVEVNLDDTLEWDAKTIVSQLADATQPFDPVTNPVSDKFGSGVPILENGQPTGAGAAFDGFGSDVVDLAGFVMSLQGIHDDIRVDTAISLLQTIGAAELISSPTVTVVNGHRARLVTGDKLPIFEASGNVNNPNVTTKFVDTGVEIEIVPFLVGDDLIRIDTSIEVSTQTGSVPFVISGVTVSSPIISQRNAGTTVHVHHDQVFALGGLRQQTQIETISKVPLLGDIPIIGWLFKSRRSQVRKTEILFFITPKVLVPSETLIDPFRS